MKPLQKVIFAGAMCFIFTTTYTVADRHYVYLGSTEPTYPYTNGWSTAATNIQDAVDAADDGDEVEVEAGTYYITSTIVVDKDITIKNIWGNKEAVIDGGGAVRCVYVAPESSCLVRGFTIQNGYTTGYGGGMSRGAAQYCTFTNNTALYGGGLYSVSVTNCTVTHNTALEGGGGLLGGMAVESLVAMNAADYAAGVLDSKIVNCTITSNTAASDSGGMYSGIAEGCIFNGNEADHGGGLSYVQAMNCTVRDNNAALYGGGMYFCEAVNCKIINNAAYHGGGGIYGGSIINCTVSDNSATNLGGGIMYGTANNCVVWYNSAGSKSNDCYSTTLNYSCSPDTAHGIGGNITNAPLFKYWSYQLTSNSPCIDSGNNTYVLTATDLDGNSRIIDGTLDMGAYEYVSLSHYVSHGGSHVYPYTSWATAANSIQAAVDVATPGDTVTISNGTYELATEIAVTNAIILQSIAGTDAVVLDGQHSTRVLSCRNGAVVDGFTITSGYDDYQAGGIFCRNGSVVQNCLISDNYCEWEGGGAICVDSRLQNCTIVNNHALEDGGGVIMIDSDVENCIVLGNSSTFGNQNFSDYGGSWNNCCTIPSYGANCIAGDPQFLAVGNYRLQPSSPCIDAGKWNSDVMDDLDGTPRPLDGNNSGEIQFDIGAYEYAHVEADSDHDLMPDRYELQYGFNPADYDGHRNADLDPHNNRDEYIAGTDPTNAASYFCITNEILSESGFLVEWSSIPGRTYSAFWSTNLQAGFHPVESGMEYPRNSCTDTAHGAAGSCFYRLEVRLKE